MTSAVQIEEIQKTSNDDQEVIQINSFFFLYATSNEFQNIITIIKTHDRFEEN